MLMALPVSLILQCVLIYSVLTLTSKSITMKLTRYIFILLALTSVISCKKFLDVNTNPNSPTTPTINGLLTRTTESVALNDYRVSNITSYYVQYLASPNPDAPTD